MTLRRALTMALALWVAISLGCGGADMPATASMAPPGGGYRGGESTPAKEASGGDFGGLEAAFRRPEADEPPPAVAAPSASAAPSSPPGTETQPAQRGPMIVYTAALHLSVFQVAAASKEVETMAREVGGWLSRRDDTEIVIRVPVARFDDTMKRLELLGDVIHRNVTAEDVSEQFMDAEVRLKNARAVRDRLKALLEKATKVDDSLAIEKELARIGTDIETLEARLKYLREQAQFSTITVRLQAKQTDDVGKKAVRIPVDWLDQLGLGRLLSL